MFNNFNRNNGITILMCIHMFIIFFNVNDYVHLRFSCRFQFFTRSNVKLAVLKLSWDSVTNANVAITTTSVKSVSGGVEPLVTIATTTKWKNTPLMWVYDMLYFGNSVGMVYTFLIQFCNMFVIAVRKIYCITMVASWLLQIKSIYMIFMLNK